MNINSISRVAYAIDWALSWITSSSETSVVSGFWNSGTTWVQQIVADATRSRRIFEPFYFQLKEYRSLVERYQPEDCTDWPFFALYYPFYGTELQQNSQAVRYVQNALSGCLRGKDLSARNPNWLRSVRSHRGEHFRPRVTVKFVRGQLMVPHLCEHYDIPVVHVWRDPRAVIASMKRRGWRWFTTGSLRYLLLHPDDGRQDFFSTWADHADALDRNGTWIQKTVAYWALGEMFLRQRTNKILFVNYEQLLLEPEPALASIYSMLPTVRNSDSDVLSRESATTQEERHGMNPLERAMSWRNELTESEIDEVNQTLDMLDMRHVLNDLPVQVQAAGRS